MFTTFYFGIIEASKLLKKLNKLKQKPSIYRHDVSDPDLNPIFFIFGFIFAILGSLFAGFRFTKQESNATATWYGVGCGLIAKLFTFMTVMMLSSNHDLH